MLPLEIAIASPLKRFGFRKKARTWWRMNEETICVLNLQKIPYGERIYVNLGVYIRALGQELNPPENRCHVQMRLERITSEKKWNEIVSAESFIEPSSGLIEAILNDGIAWLNQMSTLDGIRLFINDGGASKSLVMVEAKKLVLSDGV